MDLFIICETKALYVYKRNVKHSNGEIERIL